MCRKESWGAIAVPKEAHSTQRGQPPRMHGPCLWRYEQKEQRVTSVPLSGVIATSGARSGTAKISEVGRSKTQQTLPDQGTNTEYYPLLEGQPVEYIKHVGRYVSSSRNASYDNLFEAAKTHSRETNVECGAVSRDVTKAWTRVARAFFVW